MRVDVWDIKKAEDEAPLDCGYPRDFDAHFTVDRAIGKGGFGLVRVVIERSTGQEFACKSIKKRLDVPNISPAKQAQHLDNVDREARILKRLRGTLSVVAFRGAWEDDTDVHLVMEYCRGGELHHSIGMRSYTEGSVAGYLRSVLHTLAQCHSHRILHRDVKPGNFMLLTQEEGSPLKAIDFGLAAFYDPDALPRTDLGLDGTPWFMAPETLNSETYPASDLWAAGVMAYQLLSGYLPFDDARNPNAPALSVIWRGILTEEPSFRRSAWAEVSPEAKDFVKALLNKDHTARPTAKEALKHPWLQTAFHAGRRRPLNATVVQRIQRFAQTNLLRRTILELMANELIKLAPPRLSDPSVRGGGAVAALGTSPGSASDGHPSTDQGDGSTHSGGVFPMSPEKGSILGGSGGGDAGGGSGAGPSDPRPIRQHSLDHSGHGGHAFARSPSVQQLATLARAASRRGAATVHGPGDYWRIMRQASEAAAIASGHGQMNYLRAVPRSEEERQEQRKAARLSLDTSAHGGGRFAEFMARLEEEAHTRRKVSAGGMRGSVSMGSLKRHPELATSAPAAPGGLLDEAEGEEGGQSAAPLFPPVVPEPEAAAPMEEDTMEKGGRGRSLAFQALQAEGGPPAAAPDPLGDVRTVKRVTFGGPPAAAAPPPEPFNLPSGGGADGQSPSEGSLRRRDSHSGPVTNPQELEGLMRRLQFRSGRGLGREALAQGLRELGYDLAPSEVAVLMDQLDLDADATVDPAEFVASQLDWGALQRGNRDLWLECARRAFADLDTNSDGRLTAADLVASLKAKLPADEVDFAVEDALLAGGGVDAEDIDFEGFLRMLRVGSLESLDSLDQYDDRMRRSSMELDASLHGAASGLHRLEPVPEERPQK